MMRLGMLSAMTCSVCDQLVDPERQHVETGEVVLFGAARFAWCVECHQEVPRPWSTEYKRRWRRAARPEAVRQPGAVAQLRTAWQEGVVAQQRGRPIDACPYPPGLQRIAWREGYQFAAQFGSDPGRGFRLWLRSARVPPVRGAHP